MTRTGRFAVLIGRSLSRLGLILSGAAAALLLLEALMRIFAEQMPPPVQLAMRGVRLAPWSEARVLPAPIWAVDNYFGIVSHPNNADQLQVMVPTVAIHVTTINWLDPNSHVGFRVDSPDWQPRWPVDAVIVGDSFTFCITEFTDCWTQRLADRSNLSVVNLGLAGTGPTSHLRILETFGLPYQPRFVIWQWAGNDFLDEYQLALFSGELVNPDYHPPDFRREPASPLIEWLRENSLVYTLLDTPARRAEEVAADPVRIDPYRVREAGFDIAFGSDAILEEFGMSGDRQVFGWGRAQIALRAARDLLAESDRPLILLLIPSKEEVYRRWTELYVGTDWLEAVSEGRLRMIDFCQREGLLCLDVTETLTAYAEQGEQLYWTFDGHLNPRGNEVVAQAIWGFLVEQGLVEE